MAIGAMTPLAGAMIAEVVKLTISVRYREVLKNRKDERATHIWE